MQERQGLNVGARTTKRSTHHDGRQTLDGDFSSSDSKNPVVERECDGTYVFRMLESERELIMGGCVPKGDGRFCRKCDELLVLW